MCILLLIPITNLLGVSCADLHDGDTLGLGWINWGRQLIQCNESHATSDPTFVKDFQKVIDAIQEGNVDTNNVTPSQELLDDANSLQNTSDKYTILNSKVYQFLSQPYYHMFMKNFGMGPSQNYTWDICVPTPACVGNSPQFCFGNQKICDQSSSLYPVLVGWAERNIGPNLHDFIHDPNSVTVSHGAFDLTNQPESTNLYYLVGDPSCPSNSEQHYCGCRVCDQFLNNGQSTAAYKFCQFGYNWTHPLMWYGNAGQGYDGSLQIDNSNLLEYLYLWINMWWLQGSWWWLNITSNQYAPIPTTWSELWWQWGKNGNHNAVANITNCMSVGKQNLWSHNQNDQAQGHYCLNWNAPGFKPCVPCGDPNIISSYQNQSQFCSLNQGYWGNSTPWSNFKASTLHDRCKKIMDPVTDYNLNKCNFWDGTVGTDNTNDNCKSGGS